MIRQPFVIIGLVALALATPVQAADTFKPITTLTDPAFQRWLKETQSLAAEKQVEAVVKKLAELNPNGFSPEMFSDARCGCSFLIEKGAVKEFKFYAAGTADISPVRAFADLKTLECFGDGDGAVGQGGKLTDLSPLRGMALQRLNCSNTGVANLSPLKGLPLTSLDCAQTAVSDLTPLTGMKLTRLDCNFSLVSDLSPLKGMPLVELDCSGTEVADLSPLLRMPLTNLSCGFTKVSDLTPLLGMPLTELACYETRVSTLAPLRGMPLKRLLCEQTQVADLSPLEDCRQLEEVSLTDTKVIGAAVAQLKKALPKCSIRWDDRAAPPTK